MKSNTFQYFNKYKKVAILSTSNSLSRKRERLGLIYYSVKAIHDEILELTDNVQVDMLDVKEDKDLNLLDIETSNPNDYDCVVLMNHIANFFAGTLPKSFYNALKFINGFKGDVYWCYDTPDYFPTKTHVELIQQYGKYTYKPYNAKLAEMLKDQKFVESLDDIDNRMLLISDLDFENIPKENRSRSQYAKDFYSRISNSIYIKSHSNKKIGMVYSSKNDFSQKKYDLNLAYNYDKYRFSLAKKYVDDSRLNISSVRHSFEQPLSCKVDLIDRIHNIERYYDFLETRNYASLMITTKNHLGCLIPERLFGVFNSYCVGFIPIECDPDKRWIKDKQLKEFTYVSNKEELISKIQKIKDKDFFDKIIMLQRNELKEN